MAADKIMETLARLEHKVDLLIKGQLKNDLATVIKQLGDIGHSCPVCNQTVDYQVDVTDGVVLRKCGCKTGKIALNIGAFAPPVLPAKRNQDDRESDEDRNDPDNRPRRNPKR